MSKVGRPSNKAKIARRVVEVLEYFDMDHPEATVMDIVRRYDRPQSSTSELLSSLVELGILEKDLHARSYRPTIRAALLGAATQSSAVREGKLVALMDRLVAQTGLPIVLLSLSGLESQVVSIRLAGRASASVAESLHGGKREAATRNAAGQLLLSTLEGTQREGALRRLNAEASEEDKFDYRQMLLSIARSQEMGYILGPAGFGCGERMLAMLLPTGLSNQPHAVAAIFDGVNSLQVDAMRQSLEEAIRHCIGGPEGSRLAVEPLSHAA